MRILVTGGAGYIGSVLVSLLLERGHDVIVLDNFLHGQQSLYHLCHNRKLHIVKGDVRDRKLMERLLTTKMRPSFIIPLAAIVGKPACDLDPFSAVTVNVDAIRTMLKIKEEDQAIIYPCTNSGYGTGQLCTEDTPLNPISCYGQTKVKAEGEIMYNGNAISLRLATVFGCSPRMRYDLLVNNLVYRAVTDGFVVLYEAHFMRNYIHIRDVARAFIHCMDNWDKMKNQVYNVGLSSANLSKRDLCAEIRKQVPNFYVVESAIGEDQDKRDYMVSNAKIEATGYKPQVSLEEGIAELIRGYQMLK
jgi:nucleoside-diphosphate-sugar epimerase